MEKKFKKLVNFNLIMGFLHFIQSGIMLILSTSVIQKISQFKPNIIQNYLSYNSQTNSLEPATRSLFDLPFGILTASFLFISAIFHLIIYLNKEKYIEGLKKNINRFRWFEYSISSSIMMVLIATLFGIYDIVSLMLIFAANAIMNIFGLIMEEMNSLKIRDGKVNWEPFVYGAIIGIVPWISILIYIFGTGNFDMIPWFVWAIIITYFVSFNSFAINMILQYKKIGKWKDYLYGERMYIILSLIAKTILAWLVLFGAMQP